MKKNEKIQEIFRELYYSDTDWSLAADKFIQWCVDTDFEKESFKDFVDWIDERYIEDNEVWNFFFGYGDDFERFANDWINEEEKEEYLGFCTDCK